MKRYLIENARCDITEGGFACGPVPGHVVVTIQFKDGNKRKWLSLAEAGGLPNVYLSNKDVHEALVAEDFDDDEFLQYMNAHFIGDFDGIEFSDDYSTVFESIAENPENPAVPLIRYLVALARCSSEDTESLIQMATGKYADELDIPVSDVEEDFMEENDVE